MQENLPNGKTATLTFKQSVVVDTEILILHGTALTLDAVVNGMINTGGEELRKFQLAYGDIIQLKLGSKAPKDIYIIFPTLSST